MNSEKNMNDLFQCEKENSAKEVNLGFVFCIFAR